MKIQGYQHGREGGEDTGLPAWESGEKVVKIQGYQHGREGGEDTGLPAWERRW